MKNNSMKSFASYLIIGLLFFGFQSLGQGSSKNLPKYEGEKINKLLVIVLVQKLDNRITLEDELKYTFSDYGVTAVPSHGTTLRVPKNLSKDKVLGVCKKGGFDGVLVVKLVDIEEQNGYSYNQRSQYTSGGTASATSTGVVIGGGQSYSWGQYAYGNYFDTVKSSKVDIQSDVFKVNEDFTKEDMIFAADTKMRVGETEKAIGDFAKKLTKKVVKKKLLVRSDD
ncbi:MAG: hypothetical protein JXR07_04345 [Reichenbachiella sp.]